MPVACRCPLGYGQIHTSSQAGGIASSAIRVRTSGSSTLRPVVVLVAEAAAAPPAADPGPGAVGAAQAGRHDCVLPLAPGFRLPQACLRSRSRPPSRDRPPSSRSRASSTSPARPRSSRSWAARRAPSSLDLRGLVFMDSSGLRAIAMAAQRAEAAGRSFALVAGRGGGDARVRHHAHARAAGLRRPARGAGAGTMRLEVELPRDPDSAAEARRALGEVADHLSPRRLEDARLLVSELVTNAIRHAGLGDDDVILLVLVTGERALRIEVCDPGRGFEVSEPEPDPTRPVRLGALPRARALGPLGRRAQRRDPRLVRAGPRRRLSGPATRRPSCPRTAPSRTTASSRPCRRPP